MAELDDTAFRHADALKIAVPLVNSRNLVGYRRRFSPVSTVNLQLDDARVAHLIGTDGPGQKLLRLLSREGTTHPRAPHLIELHVLNHRIEHVGRLQSLKLGQNKVGFIVADRCHLPDLGDIADILVHLHSDDAFVLLGEQVGQEGRRQNDDDEVEKNDPLPKSDDPPVIKKVQAVVFGLPGL